MTNLVCTPPTSSQLRLWTSVYMLHWGPSGHVSEFLNTHLKGSISVGMSAQKDPHLLKSIYVYPRSACKPQPHFALLTSIIINPYTGVFMLSIYLWGIGKSNGFCTSFSNCFISAWTNIYLVIYIIVSATLYGIYYSNFLYHVCRLIVCYNLHYTVLGKLPLLW